LISASKLYGLLLEHVERPGKESMHSENYQAPEVLKLIRNWEIEDIPFIVTERVHKDATIRKALDIMYERNLDALGVTNIEGKFEGIIRREDLMLVFVKKIAEEV